MRKSLIATLVALAAMTTAAAASGHSDVTLRATGIILGLLHDMGCSSYELDQVASLSRRLLQSRRCPLLRRQVRHPDRRPFSGDRQALGPFRDIDCDTISRRTREPWSPAFFLLIGFGLRASVHKHRKSLAASPPAAKQDAHQRGLRGICSRHPCSNFQRLRLAARYHADGRVPGRARLRARGRGPPVHHRPRRHRKIDAPALPRATQPRRDGDCRPNRAGGCQRRRPDHPFLLRLPTPPHTSRRHPPQPQWSRDAPTEIAGHRRGVDGPFRHDVGHRPEPASQSRPSARAVRRPPAGVVR